jgi:hypothetical protein
MIGCRLGEDVSVSVPLPTSHAAVSLPQKQCEVKGGRTEEERTRDEGL